MAWDDISDWPPDSTRGRVVEFLEATIAYTDHQGIVFKKVRQSNGSFGFKQEPLETFRKHNNVVLFP